MRAFLKVVKPYVKSDCAMPCLLALVHIIRMDVPHVAAAVIPSHRCIHMYTCTQAHPYTHCTRTHWNDYLGVLTFLSPPPAPQAGVNVWRALRDTSSIHPAWRHIAGKPVTEADLPRPISNPSSQQPQGLPAGDIAAAVKAAFRSDMQQAGAGSAAAAGAAAVASAAQTPAAGARDGGSGGSASCSGAGVGVGVRSTGRCGGWVLLMLRLGF